MLSKRIYQPLYKTHSYEEKSTPTYMKSYISAAKIQILAVGMDILAAKMYIPAAEMKLNHGLKYLLQVTETIF